MDELTHSPSGCLLKARAQANQDNPTAASASELQPRTAFIDPLAAIALQCRELGQHHGAQLELLLGAARREPFTPSAFMRENILQSATRCELLPLLEHEKKLPASYTCNRQDAPLGEVTRICAPTLHERKSRGHQHKHKSISLISPSSRR